MSAKTDTLPKFLLTLVAILLLSWPATALAQQDDTTKYLARATLNGYLTSLKSGYLDAETITRFYLDDSLADSEIAAELFNLGLTDYRIDADAQPNDQTYLVTVILQPGDRRLQVKLNRIGDSAWVITNLAWGQSTTSQPAAETATETGVTATIAAQALNLRAGPGTQYAALDTLTQGEVLAVNGLNYTSEWYQVTADNGQTGWLSASPTYVQTEGNVSTLAAIAAPALSSVNRTGAASQGTLILQPRSGDTIYRVNADGSGLTPLTSGIDPALSPDGTQIAFTRWGDARNIEGSVWVYDLTTNQEWQVLGEIKQPKSATWSADGSQLIVSYQNGGRPEIEERCTTSGKRLPPGAYDIQVGSTSGKICYKLPADPYWQLRQINVADGSFEDLAAPTYAQAPTQDPANDWRVVMAADRGLVQLDLNRDEYFAFSDDARQRGPLFSPDGSQVAVSYQQHDHWEVYTINTADGSLTRLTPVSSFSEVYNSAAPAWSPDGSQIVFVTDRDGEWAYWIMDADGSNARPLFSDEVTAQLGEVQYYGQDERMASWGQ